jgi:uncharacterized protein
MNTNDLNACFVAILFWLAATVSTTVLADASTKAEGASIQEIAFQKQKIKIANKVLSVEIADTDEKRAHGLMFRETLKQDHGMLFIFDAEEPLGFWMKNTLIPLSIGYFDQNKKLMNVLEMSPAIAGEAHPKTYHSVRPAKYALEMPKGWFSRNKVEIGAEFSFLK